MPDPSVDSSRSGEITRSFPQNAAMVCSSETWIKNGTVRDNISIGKPEATDAEIIEAAKLTHSWEFIHRLPKGLDTMLTEDSLSQGQKQLLCITRVMLCLPPMLLRTRQLPASIPERNYRFRKLLNECGKWPYKLYRCSPSLHHP